MQLSLFDDPKPDYQEEDYYTCRRCKELLHISNFRVRSDSGRKGYRVKSCRSCEQQEGQELISVHRTAPPKPTHCDCCGSVTSPEFMRLDHCHETLKFRGWLCNTCNGGIAFLGDNIEGVEKALTYLKRHYHGSTET